MATLEDFVLNACANELGLEVPGHHQAASPLEPAARARGMDLTPGECNALVAYVRGLPSPVLVAPPGPRGSELIAEGRKLFQSIGCATCHAPDLGTVRGIYSDLLLHDMGKATERRGNSYSDDLESRDTPKRGEWRTPPLWGFRDSGPYLHDGRAPDLDHAVALHDGQAAASALEFRTISQSQRSLIHDVPQLAGRPGSAGSTEVSRAADTEARDVERTWTEDVVRRGESRIHTAEMLEKIGKTQGALEFYREVVREAPDSPRPDRGPADQTPRREAACLSLSSAIIWARPSSAGSTSAPDATDRAKASTMAAYWSTDSNSSVRTRSAAAPVSGAERSSSAGRSEGRRGREIGVGDLDDPPRSRPARRYTGTAARSCNRPSRAGRRGIPAGPSGSGRRPSRPVGLRPDPVGSVPANSRAVLTP